MHIPCFQESCYYICTNKLLLETTYRESMQAFLGTNLLTYRLTFPLYELKKGECSYGRNGFET